MQTFLPRWKFFSPTSPPPPPHLHRYSVLTHGKYVTKASQGGGWVKVNVIVERGHRYIKIISMSLAHSTSTGVTPLPPSYVRLCWCYICFLLPLPTLDAEQYTANCDFEAKRYCGYTNEFLADLAWIRNAGATLSPGTGPVLDHTFNNLTGKERTSTLHAVWLIMRNKHEVGNVQ